MKKRQVLAMSLIVGATMVASQAAFALSDADKCVAAKQKEAGKYVFCRMKAESKAVKKGTTPDFSKCDAKLSSKWTKIETKAAGACPTTGDEAAIRNIAVADAGLLAGTVAVKARFQDNGNGTITDLNTGLTWEKKSYGDDSVHDITSDYTWHTATSVHVATLNGMSFGGFDDWRLPTVKEIVTLINFGSTDEVKGYPEFDVNCVFGCDVLSCSCAFAQTWGGETFWTSTTNAEDPVHAWVLTTDFVTIDKENDKDWEEAAIAVRGGRSSD